MRFSFAKSRLSGCKLRFSYAKSFLLRSIHIPLRRIATLRRKIVILHGTYFRPSRKSWENNQKISRFRLETNVCEGILVAAQEYVRRRGKSWADLCSKSFSERDRPVRRAFRRGREPCGREEPGGRGYTLSRLGGWCSLMQRLCGALAGGGGSGANYRVVARATRASEPRLPACRRAKNVKN